MITSRNFQGDIYMTSGFFGFWAILLFFWHEFNRKINIVKYIVKAVNMLKRQMTALAKCRLFVLVGILCTFLGYSLASLLVCVETWIDCSSGIIEDRIKLFPFSLKCEQKTAFNVYYGRYVKRHSTANWLFVCERHVNPLIYYESITKGEYLTRAEAQIIQADMVHSFTAVQREHIANEFFDRLLRNGVLSAYHYSDDILLNGYSNPK